MRHIIFILLGFFFGFVLTSVVSIATWQFWVIFIMWATAGMLDDWIVRTF